MNSAKGALVWLHCRVIIYYMTVIIQITEEYFFQRRFHGFQMEPFLSIPFNLGYITF